MGSFTGMFNPENSWERKSEIKFGEFFYEVNRKASLN
jgi:hypothetical protein